MVEEQVVYNLNMQKIKNYIGGELIDPISGNYIDNYNPANGNVYSLIPDSNKQDVENAVRAAAAAFPNWSTTPAAKRSDTLMKIAALIDENIEKLALAESIDNGKPLKLAMAVDIPRASKNFRFYATGILHNHNDAYSQEDTSINYTLRQPIGIAGCISPWNLPLYLFTWKIAPALAPAPINGNSLLHWFLENISAIKLQNTERFNKLKEVTHK